MQRELNPEPHRFQHKRWLRLTALWLAPLALISGNGCRLAERTVMVPVNAVTTVVTPNKPAAPDPALLQLELQRLADEFTSRTGEALDAYEREIGTAEAHSQALQWKVLASASAISIASGPNPNANLLDFISLTTITRTVLEEILTKGTNGAAYQAWLDASRSLESSAWNLASRFLTPDQQKELRDGINRWWESHPKTGTSFFARPDHYSPLIRQTSQKGARSGSVFSYVGLDPTAGLDPAVQEVTRTRLFAERAMYLMQRMPFLLRWQIELMTVDLLRQTELSQALNSVNQIGQAASSISQTAKELPDRLTAERQAIVSALETQEGSLRGLAEEINHALVAGEQMATSLNTALVTFDALMKRFGVGEPPRSPSRTNATPFKILDYAQTAEQITAMAEQLNVLLKETDTTLGSSALDRRLAEFKELPKNAQAELSAALNHAFLLAAGLVLLILGAALTYRRLAPGPAKEETKDAGP